MSLRRFTSAGAAEEAARSPIPARERPRPGEACEMCAEPLDERHGHLVDLTDRRLMCTCRACSLLFEHQGAAGGRHYRKVPERYRYEPDFTMDDSDWIFPVRMAFFFRNSDLGRTVAFYPSPGGATESELSMDAWVRMLAGSPSVADMEPDVEALLVDRDSGAYLVPIDQCYALVGLVRMHWKGFDGGEEAWRRIDAFFAELREKGRHG